MAFYGKRKRIKQERESNWVVRIYFEKKAAQRSWSNGVMRKTMSIQWMQLQLHSGFAPHVHQKIKCATEKKS